MGLKPFKIAGDGDFDLILLDLNMPKLQGWDVAKSLRQMQAYEKVPIIAITAMICHGPQCEPPEWCDVVYGQACGCR